MSVYKRIDRGVYQAERIVVVTALLVMSAVVFLDVVYRSFSGTESKFAAVVSRALGWVGTDLPPDSPGYEQLAASSPYVLFVGFSALAYFGIRSTKRATPIAAPIAAVAAVGGVLIAHGLVRLLLVTLPNGLVWSQDLALVLTLWVGFVGASMCTYENRHLKVEAVQRLLPEKIRPFVGFVSGVFTTAVCLGLLWVSIRYVAYHRAEYVSTSGRGGVVAGMDLPKYLGFAALPLSFGFMSIRFFVKALAALRGEVEAPLDPLVAVGAVRPDEGLLPSDVATEAQPAVRAAEESAIDTMKSRQEQAAARSPGVPWPQSKVPTDAHDIIPPGIEPLADADPSDFDPSDFDPRETKEIEGGPIRLADVTRDLKPGELLADPADGEEEEGQ